VLVYSPTRQDQAGIPSLKNTRKDLAKDLGNNLLAVTTQILQLLIY
jgi:hypothetical protein